MAASPDAFHREGRRFLSLLLLAEEKLRAGVYPDLAAIVGELQELAATSDGANAVMEESVNAALRFDSVVAASKELRAEPQLGRNRCRRCPGAMHSEAACPFRWSPEVR